jgi:hypothetical protein
MSHEDWISDHLLGEETESDAAEAQRRLDTDPGLRDRVARLAQVAATLQRLSPAAWDTAAADPGKPVSAPARAPRARVRRLPAPAPALAALLAVALLAVGISAGALIWAGAGGGAGNAPAPARTVALGPLPGSPTHARGSATVTSGGRLTLRVNRLPSAGAGHYYEAWLMTNTRRLVPIASFEVNHRETAQVTVPLPAPADRYRYFDISLQSISHGTAHSHDSVLRGLTSSRAPVR